MSRIASAIAALGVLAALLIVATVQTARAEDEIYRTEAGKRCIAEWITLVGQRLNAFDGDREFNSRKPWSINQYGLFVAKRIASVAAPDDWGAKGATRDSWMWLTYTSELHYPDWGNRNLNGARLEGLRWYVRQCVGGGGGSSSGYTGPNPCDDPPTAAMTPFDNTLWEFGRTDGSIIAKALKLVPGGDIGGHDNANEHHWRVLNGHLVFCRSSNTPGTVFTDEAIVGGRRVLQGRLILADGKYGRTVHVLRQVLAGGGGGVGAMTGGVNLPDHDYHDFRLRSADPALCHAACQADIRCRAWTYVRPGSTPNTPHCWLKNPAPSPVLDDCCVSGTIQ